MEIERTVGKYTYKIKFISNSRKMRMRVKQDRTILVTSSPYFTYKELDAFVLKNSNWIDKRLSETKVPTFQTGDTVLLYGEEYDLIVLKEEKLKVEVGESTITIKTPNTEVSVIKQIIRQLYIETIKKIAAVEIPEYCKLIGRRKAKFVVSSAKTKWGSCCPSQNLIRISYMTAVLPYDLIEYIIFHEVCHLEVPCHGPDFWGFMYEYMPDGYEREDLLSQLVKEGKASCPV